jgi:hypothetical protein
MEKSTIPSGFIAAHGHSGLLGRSPASLAMAVAFGQPTVHGRVQSTASAWSPRWARSVHAAWRGVLWHGGGYHGQGLHLDHPHGSSY